MPEYIEREVIVQKIQDGINNLDFGFEAIEVLGLIYETPNADVVGVRHGEWVETQGPLGWCDVDCIECSVCHESWIIDEDSSIDDYEYMWHYCPNCGAKMDGDTE